MAALHCCRCRSLPDLLDSFTKCLTNQKLLDEVNATRERGSKDFGVNATPTFLINGKRYSGDMPVDTMSALIDSLL